MENPRWLTASSNIAAAWEVCKQLAIDQEVFLKHISTFKGAAKRLEKLHDDGNNVIFKDFAHAPSKVRATVEAVKEVYAKKNIIAVLELHTFSSLNKSFLHQYRRTMRSVKHKIVFINADTLKMKGYPPISKQELVEAFDDPAIEYASTPAELQTLVRKLKISIGNVFLFMSSGPYAGLDLKELALG